MSPDLEHESPLLPPPAPTERPFLEKLHLLDRYLVWWRRLYRLSDEDVLAVAAAYGDGLSFAQIQRLLVRRRAFQRAELSEELPTDKRLRFARWLYLRGKISDGAG